MAVLTWSNVGERYFEAGADRGVLFVASNPGVAWSGLTAVKESPTGGEAQPFYVDGFKYANVASAEEFEATIEAFFAPREFGVCDGTASLLNGLFATQQPRIPFGFSYRTRLGNDVDGPDHAYKIHLVYNALAAPASRDNATIGESANPANLSWSITTRPHRTTGIKPTAHFVIDSRATPPVALDLLENMLYGTDVTQPKLPSVDEIRAIFSSFLPYKLEGVFIGVLEIYNVDPMDSATIMGPVAAPLKNGQSLLWLDTSDNAGYAIPRLVTGD